MLKKLSPCILSLILVFSVRSAQATQPTTIEIGDYLVMGKYYDEPILWRCVDIDENGPLMLSDRILCLKNFDAPGDNVSSSHSRGTNNGSQRRKSGSDYWADSNMRCWLNSTASAGNVAWLCGNPPAADKVMDGYNPYAQEEGFLASGNFTMSERNAIKTVTQKTLINPCDHPSYPDISPEYHRYNEGISVVVQNYDTAYSEQVTDKMFLLDVKQIHRVFENKNILGTYYHIGRLTQKAVDNTSYEAYGFTAGSSWPYWLRSPRADYGSGHSVRYVSSSTVGYIHSGDARNYANGVRPAFYLDLSNTTHSMGDGGYSTPFHLSSQKDGYELQVWHNGSLGSTVNICNYTLQDLQSILFVAEYNNSNRLIDITAENILAEAGDCTVVQVPQVQNGDNYFKVFLLNENLSPLANSVIID